MRLRRSAGGRLRALQLALVRLLVAAATTALAGFGIVEMHAVLSVGQVTAVQWLFLVLFAFNFTWISFAAVQAAVGFLRTLLAKRRQAAEPGIPDGFRSAVLVPVYNEDMHRVAAAIAVLRDELSQLAPGRFDIFVLSDSTDPWGWLAEEAAIRDLTEVEDPACPVYYRHRPHNEERKAGNIADWVRRWGGGYQAMAILDADSVMSGHSLVTLAGRLAANPDLGLIQTLPHIVRARTLYARLQAFANRCYGPIYGNGLAAWHGRSSNYWGHNAILRVAAFAPSCHLPILPGRPPFGGHVLSHDFIEAAMLRRAGWGVRLDTDIAGSYEEAPPSLSDVITRDRRWCQGNLQHTRFLFARGLSLCTRLHLLSGIWSYLSAPVWLFLVLTGLLIALQAQFIRPEFFTEPSLFPRWPVFDTERAINLFLLSMAIVLLPKLLGWLAALLRPQQARGFGGPLRLTGGVLAEGLLSALLAPVMMLAQCSIVRAVLARSDAGWQPQRRDDGAIPWSDALRAHSWHMVFGIAIGAMSFALSPQLFYWMVPLCAGPALSVPLSRLSGSTVAGRWLRRAGLLLTPEERQPPRIVEALEERLEREVRPSPPRPALSRFFAEPELLRWHLQQLPPCATQTPGKTAGSFDPVHALARAKADAAISADYLVDWLSPAELMALLHDHTYVHRLASAWPPTGTVPTDR